MIFVNRKNDKNSRLKKNVENEYRCDSIFKSPTDQPYLNSAQAGKWGKGKDDSFVDEDEYPPYNNPLPR